MIDEKKLFTDPATFLEWYKNELQLEIQDCRSALAIGDLNDQVKGETRKHMLDCSDKFWNAWFDYLQLEVLYADQKEEQKGNSNE